MKFLKKFSSLLVILVFLVLAKFVFDYMDRHFNEYTENTYILDELEDGVNVNTYRVSSNVPANNYDVAIICVDGVVKKYSGTIQLIYTEKQPYCVVKQYVNLCNSNYLTIYIPKGSIKYQENVGTR